MEVAKVLSKFSDDSIIQILIHLLRVVSYRVRLNSLYAIYSSGEFAIPILRNAVLTDTNKKIRLNAMIAIGMLHDKEIIPLLKKLMGEETDKQILGKMNKLIGLIEKQSDVTDFEE
jgi:HEAT repeat protein